VKLRKWLLGGHELEQAGGASFFVVAWTRLLFLRFAILEGDRKLSQADAPDGRNS
jgi:hypothetical protein